MVFIRYKLINFDKIYKYIIIIFRVNIIYIIIKISKRSFLLEFWFKLLSNKRFLFKKLFFLLVFIISLLVSSKLSK